MFFGFKKNRVHTPTILQMEITECGAAALSIILSYYGTYIPSEQMRIECGVSRDGSNALNMLKAAQKHGLKTQAVKIDKLDEIKKIVFPFIVYWEFNHFVVVEGVEKNKFYINDPATGPRTVTRDEFDKSFTGVAFLFTPKKNFRKIGKPFVIYNVIKEKLRGEKKTFLFIAITSLFLVISGKRLS